MTEEKLSREDAVHEVLHDNLFGLEIDPRCTQIAAFNLALAAWRMVGHRQLPQLQLACSGLSLGVSKDEWSQLAERVSPLPPDNDRFVRDRTCPRNKSGQALNRSTICSNGRRGWGA